jgi:GNAT superfamily N-acetyltransferase
MRIHIRPATVDDAAAISAVHRSNVTQWRRWEDDGTLRPARYADLTPFQRWINGGPWLDPQMCAYHLRRRMRGGSTVLVAEVPKGGRILAEAELSLADEPRPFGRNLNLAVLYVHRNYHRQGLGSALMKHTLALARVEGCDTYTVAHADAPGFYRRHGLRGAERWTRFRIPVRVTRVRYTLEPLPNASYDLVRGWAMPLGRYQNAHHDWERVRPGAVPAFKEWQAFRVERFWLTAGRSRAAIIFDEQPQYPGVANTFLYTPARLTPALVSAARDLAARLGFSHLHCYARTDTVLPDARRTGYTNQVFVRTLAGED